MSGCASLPQRKMHWEQANDVHISAVTDEIF